MLENRACFECHVSKMLPSSRDVCALVSCDNKTYFMKVLGSNTHGPLNPTEISLHASVIHPNILNVRCVKNWISTTIENGISIVLDAAQEVLIDWIQNKVRTIDEKLRYAYECVCAVYVLHENRYLHLDIKPDNFVIVDNVCKITDFGFSRKSIDEKLRVKLNHKTLGRPYVTPAYRAPELWQEGDEVIYTDKADIFSLGLTLLAIFTRTLIYPSSLDISNEDKIQEFIFSKMKDEKTVREYIIEYFQQNGIPHEYYSGIMLITSMLNFDPNKRPDISTVLRHEIWRDRVTPISATILTSNYPKLSSLVSTIDMQNDIFFVVNTFIDIFPKIPCACMFLAVDLYYRTTDMLNTKVKANIQTQRKYLCCSCIWLGITTVYTEDTNYYNFLIQYFQISNPSYLDKIIVDIIVYLGGILQPNSYFDIARNAEDLRYYVREYLKKPDLYILYKPVILTHESQLDKFISIEELNY